MRRRLVLYGDSIDVTVVPRAIIHAENIIISGHEEIYENNISSLLTANLTPDGVTDEVVWHSDNEEIATVKANGDRTAIVSGVGKGTVKITASCGDKSAEFNLTVTPSSEECRSCGGDGGQDMATASVYCSDCGTFLCDGMYSDSPCPRCGSERDYYEVSSGGWQECGNCDGTGIATVDGVAPHRDFEGGKCSLCGYEGSVIQTPIPYQNNMDAVVVGRWDYSGAKSVYIKIEYATEDKRYDCLLITSGLDFASGSSLETKRNYLSTSGSILTTTGTDSSVKFGGSYNIKSFNNVKMTSGTLVFTSDSSNASGGAIVTVVPKY